MRKLKVVLFILVSFLVLVSCEIEKETATVSTNIEQVSSKTTEYCSYEGWHIDNVKFHGYVNGEIWYIVYLSKGTKKAEVTVTHGQVKRYSIKKGSVVSCKTNGRDI